MSVYTLQLDRPHPSTPDVGWRVHVWDTVDGGGASSEVVGGPHELFVPNLELWCPDTLRMVLHELSAYIPAHEPADALVTIEARMRKAGGRIPKNGVPRTPRFDAESVTLAVAARGWKAQVSATWQNLPRTESCYEAGSFTEPMQALLLELAGRSPFALAPIRREHAYAAHNPDTGGDFMPARLQIQLGNEPPWDAKKKKWREDIADRNARSRAVLDRLNKNGGEQ